MQTGVPDAAGARALLFEHRGRDTGVGCYADGAVKHVHVVRGRAERRKAIEDALRQWQFKPHSERGGPVEVGTGLVFRFGSSER